MEPDQVLSMDGGSGGADRALALPLLRELHTLICWFSPLKALVLLVHHVGHLLVLICITSDWEELETCCKLQKKEQPFLQPRYKASFLAAVRASAYVYKIFL